LALQNDSAGDLQNHRVHAIHGRRIRVGPGSARPSLHGRGASDAGPDLRAPASMEGEGPMPPWICAPGALGRCHQWWGEVERSRGPCWSLRLFFQAAVPRPPKVHWLRRGRRCHSEPHPTLGLNPTGASRAVPKEDHMASEAACKRRMGITRGVELSRRAILARWLSWPKHHTSSGGGRGVHYREGAEIH
jgi:hypothetical protein